MVQKNVKRPERRVAMIFVGLALLIVAATLLYLYSRTYAKSARLGVAMTAVARDRILSRATPALIGMMGAAVLIAFVSLTFQTITQSRLLTPSMIGFDAVFVGTQTLLVFLFGASSRVFTNPYLNYLIAAGAMVAISVIMYGMILRRGRNNIVFLLMFGLVLSGILRSGARYLQIIMDEHDYMQVQAATSITINNMNTNIIYIAVPIMLAVVAILLSRHRIYDVCALGPDNAKSLGVDYQREANLALVLVAIGMSVATAMIGSIAFLGLLAVNIARELLRTHRHLPLFIASACIAMLTLVGGQGIVELLQGAIPVTAIIDLVGCSYMFALIWKENRL